MTGVPARALLIALLHVAVFAASPRRTLAQPAPGAPNRVVVHGDPHLRELGRRLVADPSVWRPLPGIGTLPDVGVDSLDIWLAEDLSADVPPGLRHTEPWVAGTADPSARRIALRTGPALAGPGGLRSTLRHEVAHIALGAATGGRHPRWLTEGYAQYASGEWGWGDAWQLQSAFLRRGATTLSEIDLRFRQHPVDARMGYLLSYTAVHRLSSLGGEAGLEALFRRLREGSSVEQALRRTYGISAAEFERRWKASLVDRYGWLYLLSRAGVFWLGVTGLVLFVTLRRARHDRVRLQRLRDDEKRAEAAAQAEEPSGEQV